MIIHNSLNSIIFKNYLTIIFGFFILFSQALKANENIYIGYASSLHSAMKEIVNDYEKQSDVKLKFGMGASGNIAQQIMRDAPYDIFISANKKWINYLDKHQKIKERQPWISNSLSVIGSMKSIKNLTLNANERFCLADPKNAPLGLYSLEAINTLNLKIPDNQIIFLKDAASVQYYLSINECDYAITYSSNILNLEKNVDVQSLPLNLYSDITYEIGILKLNKDTKDFVNYLQQPSVLKILKNHGFIIDR